MNSASKLRSRNESHLEKFSRVSKLPTASPNILPLNFSEFDFFNMEKFAIFEALTKQCVGNYKDNFQS